MLQSEPSFQTIARRTQQDRPIDLRNPQGSIIETERRGHEQISARTIFLTGRECPLACSMCDLWQHTLPRSHSSTPIGAIPDQMEQVLSDGIKADWLKLYNASNFFDPLAVPIQDYDRIAELCLPFKRTIVENHPRFRNSHIERFQSMLNGQLEIAVGLESTDDGVLGLLNKQFDRGFALEAIRGWIQLGINVRVFLLIDPPTPYPRSTDSTYRSVVDAISWGVSHISLIPTRARWGLLSDWVKEQKYLPPNAHKVEEILRRCTQLEKHSVTIAVDLWDWDLLIGHCAQCRSLRYERLQHWNESGYLSEPINCSSCSMASA